MIGFGHESTTVGQKFEFCISEMPRKAFNSSILCKVHSLINYLRAWKLAAIPKKTIYPCDLISSLPGEREHSIFNNFHNFCPITTINYHLHHNFCPITTINYYLYHNDNSTLAQTLSNSKLLLSLSLREK